MEQEVPMYGGWGGMLCAAALASWKNHQPLVLARVAGRTLYVPEGLQDQRDDLVNSWVRRLHPRLRSRLAEKLPAALPDHQLLSFLYAAGVPRPAVQES